MKIPKKVSLAVSLSVIFLSILLIVSFFLPYASATAENRKFLEAFPQGIYMQEINMTNADAIDISLFDFTRIYGATSSAVGTACIVMIVIFALFSLLTLVFSALRKPIVILIFGGLTFAMFNLISWDFKDRGVLPSSAYNYGAAYYIYFIVLLLILAGAIFMLVMKKQEKKQAKALETSNI